MQYVVHSMQIKMNIEASLQYTEEPANLSFFRSDAVNCETSFHVIDEPEQLIGLLNRNNICNKPNTVTFWCPRK